MLRLFYVDTQVKNAYNSIKEAMEMILYRPHRGGLAESMAECRRFENIDQMKKHVVEEWSFDGYEMMAEDDIIIGEVLGDDNRVGWKNVRYVLTKRFGKDICAHPQCVGMCTLDG